MDNLVSYTDFQLPPVNIPNIEGAVEEQFDAYIAQEQEALMKKVLGKQLYDSFDEGLSEDYPEDRWLNLRDGSNYVIDGKTYEWVGFRKVLIPYIYSRWVFDDLDSLTSVGTTESQVENSKIVSANRRISREHNRASNYVGKIGKAENTLFGFLFQTGSVGTFDDTFDETFHDFYDYLDNNFQPLGLMVF